MRAAAATYRKAVEALHDRYAKVALYVAEAAALCDRFAVEQPTLPEVVSPAFRSACMEAAEIVVAVGFVEQARPVDHEEEDADTFGISRRRNYIEIQGTEGFAIIAKAGLKPFAPLTERQRQLVAERERERAEERRGSSELAVEAAIVRATPDSLSAGPLGTVKRG